MIYIQSGHLLIPHHFDCACAMYGAIDSALDYRFADINEVKSGRLDLLIKNHLFVGSVEFMREVFKRVGINDVRLPMNSDRPCEIITLKEAHERVANGDKIFIKPVEIKLFTGLVLDGCTYSCLNGLPDDTKVMAYEPFKSKILSEWRIYVHNGKMVDSRNYSGDFMLSPRYMFLQDKINTFKNFPISYTIDVGILDFPKGDYKSTDRQNVIIEFNLMVAIGNYGIPNDLYLKLLNDAYFEIIKK